GLRKAGVQVAEIYYCPHNVLSDCACRKPRPGMLLAAARDVGARPRSAWMVGDKPMDVQTGRAFGCRTAWVGPKAWRRRFAAEVRPWSPDVVADGLLEAARAIVRYSEDPVAEASRKSRADPTITS
ncbi:MAG: HAD-IIIA family hydrolase, partial [Methanobacteriota archaeon]